MFFLPSLPALPLIHNIPQRFGYVIFYPGHEFTIKMKIRTTGIQHETANILCIFVAWINERGACQQRTVPVGIHVETPVFSQSSILA